MEISDYPPANAIKSNESRDYPIIRCEDCHEIQAIDLKMDKGEIQIKCEKEGKTKNIPFESFFETIKRYNMHNLNMRTLIVANFAKIKILLKNIIYAKHVQIKSYVKNVLMNIIKMMMLSNSILIQPAKNIIILLKVIVQYAKKINALTAQ